MEARGLGSSISPLFIIENTKYRFGIYRTNTSNLTLFIAAFHYYVHRLIYIPIDSHSFNKEVSTIKYFATSNNVNINIDSLIRRKQTDMCDLNALTYVISVTTLTRIAFLRLPKTWRFQGMGEFGAYST